MSNSALKTLILCAVIISGASALSEIFDSTLGTLRQSDGWEDWSWSTTVPNDFQYPGPPAPPSGSYVLKFVVGARGGITLKNTPLLWKSHTNITFKLAVRLVEHSEIGVARFADLMLLDLSHCSAMISVMRTSNLRRIHPRITQ